MKAKAKTRREIILEYGAEGGGRTIYGTRTDDGWIFSTTLNQVALADFLDDGDTTPLVTRSAHPTRTFQEVLAICDTDRWAVLYPIHVHPAFREQVWMAYRERVSWGARDFNHDRWRRLCRPPELRLRFSGFSIPTHEVVADFGAFATFQDLLDYVYRTQLSGLLSAGTYGDTWSLTSASDAPLVKQGREDVRPLSDLGIAEGDSLTVVRGPR